MPGLDDAGLRATGAVVLANRSNKLVPETSNRLRTTRRKLAHSAVRRASAPPRCRTRAPAVQACVSPLSADCVEKVRDRFRHEIL